jgi:hypothetical protein
LHWKKRQEIELAEQQALDRDLAEAEEHLTRHVMLPNHLFEEEALKTPTKEATVEVLDLLGNRKKDQECGRSTTGQQQIHHKGFHYSPYRPCSCPPSHLLGRGNLPDFGGQAQRIHYGNQAASKKCEVP